MKNRNGRGYLKYLSLGVEIALGLSVPIFIGYRMDLRWGTSPWLLLLGAFTGMAILAGIIVRIARNTGEDS